MRTFGIAIAATLLATAAWAQEIPRYDAVAQCKHIAGFGGNYSEMLYGACLDQEQTAYDSLKPQWSSIPASVQRQCDRITRFGGPGSYMLLQSCIEQEMSAGKENESKAFKY